MQCLWSQKEREEKQTTGKGQDENNVFNSSGTMKLSANVANM